MFRIQTLYISIWNYKGDLFLNLFKLSLLVGLNLVPWFIGFKLKLENKGAIDFR